MEKNDRSIQEAGEGEILLYSTTDEKVRIDVLFSDENLWLTQKKMAELFDVDRSVITKHLGNIFKEEELKKNSVCAKIAHTAIRRAGEQMELRGNGKAVGRKMEELGYGE